MKLSFNIEIQEISTCPFWSKNGIKVGWGCGIKAKFSHVGSEPARGVPFMGVFLRDSNSYLCAYRRKFRKLRTAV